MTRETADLIPELLFSMQTIDNEAKVEELAHYLFRKMRNDGVMFTKKSLKEYIKKIK